MALAEQGFPAWVTDRLRQRGRAIIRSHGRSMQPAVPDGAHIEVRPTTMDELAVGDLVVYHYAGEVFCHRLIAKAGRFCILKGDTLLTADPPVAWSQVIGKVTTLIRPDARLVPLEMPEQRRRAAWRARLSYPYAVLYHSLRLARRALFWHHAIRMPHD